uniref:WSN domain-containing protein n=1 Tax=Caenorhabditis tropicalis TaxID=1561998 RepID=A0A1I7TE90_9PELO
MKFPKLLLIAVLIASAILPSTNSNAANDNSFATMSSVTAKGARLTSALNALSLFVQPSLDEEEVFREAISTFFTFNRSVIDDFADIDEGDVTRILNELGNVKNDSFNVADVSNSLYELERIHEKLKIPSLKENFAKSIPSTFGESSIKQFDLSSVDENIWKLDIKNMEFITKPKVLGLILNPNSTETVVKALHELPGQIREIIKLFSIDEIHSKVLSVFTSIEERKTTYELLTKDIIKSILSVKSKILANANSLRNAAKVSKSLSFMCRKVRSTDTHIKLTSLKVDLEDPTFLDTLNEEKSSEALLKVLPPILEISTKVESHWSGIEDILRNEEFRKSSEKLDRVLSLLMEAVPQQVAFQSSVKSIGELFSLIDSTIDATAYGEIEDLVGLLASYKGELEFLSKSDDFINMNAPKSVFAFFDPEKWSYPYYSRLASEKFSTVVERFKNISSSLDNLNDMRGKIATELKDLKWRHRGKKMDEWIKIVFIPFEEKMKESSEVIKRLRSAVNFLKESKNLNLPNFHSQIVLLQKKTQEVKGVVEEELKNLKPKEENEPYYKYMINLRIESSPLREQLMRASHIFGLLDHYDRNQTVFDEFFEKGLALQKKIQNDNSKSEDQKTKMSELESMKKRMDDLKEQMDIRKKRYEGKSMKELFEMRSFIDNLQNLPNPALRTDEWRAIAKSIGDEAADFKKTIDSIFDFDFTLHQRNLIGTFSNYKGYVRYNQLIVKIADIQKRTFYESNYGTIEFVTFVIGSLLVNGSSIRD